MNHINAYSGYGKSATIKELSKSCFRIFWRTRQSQGFLRAYRIPLILWVLLKAGREFAKYQALEYELFAHFDLNVDTEERALSITESAQYRKLGQWLRRWLTRLGPTFIKIGQMLSTRADLLPLPAMLELAALQEELPPFPKATARAMIIKELGAPPEVIFRKFDPVPIAAASLSQAYSAVIFDGREVVVKVQRPNLYEVISKDAEILEIIAQEANTFKDSAKHADWVGVVQEFRRATLEEIDYISEGRNVNAFRHNFRKFDRIVIPRIVWSLTSRRILTLEYVAGSRINDKAALAAHKIDPRKITALGAQFYLKQFLEDGVFHADPHPGNLRVLPDGTVGIFDFGMVGRISPKLKQHMTSALLHVVQGSYRELIDDFVEMGCLSTSCDCDALCKELTPILLTRFSQGLSRVRFRKLLFDFSEVVYRYPFKLPVEFTYIMRALLMLEGIALSIDPGFNFLDVAVPFVERLILRSAGIKRLVVENIWQGVFATGKFNMQAALDLISAVSNLHSGNGNGTKTIDTLRLVDYT